MTKNIYEILQEFEQAKTERDKRLILVKNMTQTLVTFLQLAFRPDVHFTIKEIPKYKPSGMPPGMGYSNMGQALSKAYMFIENHPRRAPKLKGTKKEQNVLINILESLEDREAVMYSQMLLKKVKVKGLNLALLEKTFEGFSEVKIKV